MHLSAMLKNSLFLLLIFVLCCNADREEMEERLSENEIELDSISYLALGDSYTIGQGVDASLRWPNQLSARLEDKGFYITTTEIIAKTGWTTSKLLEAIEASEIDGYNLVSILIGVNNQFQNQSFIIFQSEFDSLLHKAIEFAGGSDRVFAVSIPDYGVTPFGGGNSAEIAAELDMYNAYMAQKCEDLSIPFINITEISRQLGDAPDALAEDRLHPSGNQYADWVEEILPVVLDLLSE